ncbi:MAG TPA: winged helix-turn-helix domain-containing protein [Jatrophihabitans sp.]
MTTPEWDRVTPLVGKSAASARIHLQITSPDDADRALLRTLHRVGVTGTAALSALVAASDLIGRVQRVEGSGPVDLDVVAAAEIVRIDIDITARTSSLATVISSLAPFAATPSGAAATRWGTVHEPARSTVWMEVDRTATADAHERRNGGANGVAVSDPVHLLLDVTTRLSRVHTMTEVGEVVAGPLRAHLGAGVAALALRFGNTIRFATPNAIFAQDRPDAPGKPRFPLASAIPSAAVIRDGVPRLFPNAAAADRDFPGFGTKLRETNSQAMASLPLRVGDHPIGALVVAWPDARPVHRLEPLLTVVASHIAEAISRTTARPKTSGKQGAPSGVDKPVHHGRFRLDIVARTVAVAGRADPVRLTGREFELLLHLVQHAGTVVSRGAILREVWGIDFRAGTSVVDVTISRVRRKLGNDAIATVRDQGYMVRI